MPDWLQNEAKLGGGCGEGAPSYGGGGGSGESWGGAAVDLLLRPILVTGHVGA